MCLKLGVCTIQMTTCSLFTSFHCASSRCLGFFFPALPERSCWPDLSACSLWSYARITLQKQEALIENSNRVSHCSVLRNSQLAQFSLIKLRNDIYLCVHIAETLLSCSQDRFYSVHNMPLRMCVKQAFLCPYPGVHLFERHLSEGLAMFKQCPTYVLHHFTEK